MNNEQDSSMSDQASLFAQNEIRGLFCASYYAAGLLVVGHSFGCRNFFALLTERPNGMYWAEVLSRDLWVMSHDEFRTYSVSGFVAQTMLEAIQKKEHLHPKDLLCYFRIPKANFVNRSEMEWATGAKHDMIDSALRHSHAILSAKWDYIAATALHLAKNESLDGKVLAELLG
jgi:hypothetical protein